MYDAILLPTDGSEPADAALTHAMDLAGQYGATLHLLYVVDSVALASAGIDGTAVFDEIAAGGEQIVADASERAASAGVDVERAVEYGSPHEQIVEYVADHGIDLVVMGTHGRRGIGRYLIGSVTERVIRTVNVPVLAVRTVEK